MALKIKKRYRGNHWLLSFGESRFLSCAILVASLSLSGCQSSKVHWTNAPGDAATVFPQEAARSPVADEVIPPEHQALKKVDISTMNLPNAVGIAIARHPDIGRASAIVTQSNMQILVEKSAWYPTFQYSVNPGYSAYYRGQGAGKSSDSTLQGTVAANQLIYDFGTTKNRIGAARALYDRDRFLLANTVENVAVHVASTFIELAAAQELIEAAKREHVAMRLTRDKIVERTKSGLSDAVDLNQADVAIRRSQADLLSAQTRFDVAAGRFAEMTGVRPSKGVSIEETSSFINKLGKIDRSIDTTPIVLAADSEVQAALRRVEIARSQLYPSIALQNITNDSSFVGLQLSGSLNAGLRERHQITAAKAQLDAARQDSENERLVARTSLSSAQTEARGAGERMDNSRQLIALSLTSRDLYWQQYTLNRRPLTDVLNAEREAFSAESDYISAMADYLQARIRAFSAVGDLVERIRSRQ